MQYLWHTFFFNFDSLFQIKKQVEDPLPPPAPGPKLSFFLPPTVPK